MAILQGDPTERNVYLALEDVPALGITGASLTCKYRKEGQSSFTNKILTSSNWVEVGVGYYVIKFTAQEMDTAGDFYYTLAGSGFDNFQFDEFEVESASPTGGFVTTPQGKPTERNVYLTMDDEPVTGISPNSVELHYRKEGQYTFTTKPLSNSNWEEVGDGTYVIKFTAQEMDTAGYFFYTLVSGEFNNFLYDEFTIESTSPPGGGTVASEPQVCVVRGTIRNVGGSPSGRHSRILARPVEFPTSINGNLISADAQWVYPNSDGSFQFSLIQGSTVIFEIERTGIRAQVVIPTKPMANIVDLLPPLLTP